jgi:REP element-mobilizing transposase RayT
VARPIRVSFSGAVYHVTARGVGGGRIYQGDADREDFLKVVGNSCQQHGLVVHGYCLMPNHYHLLVKTPRGNVSEAIGAIQKTYSIRFNRRHRRMGHVFQARYKAILVEADAYAQLLLAYVHLNPVRPRDKKKVIPADRRRRLREYSWSSHCAYAGYAHGPHPEWLCTDWLTYFGRTRQIAREGYRHYVDGFFGKPALSPWTSLRGGLMLGGDKLWKRVCRCVEAHGGQEELRWCGRVSKKELQKRVGQMLSEGCSREVAMWLRVRLGGERMVDIASEYGYVDGSGVYQVLRRLEARAQSDVALRKSLERYRRRVSSV